MKKDDHLSLENQQPGLPEDGELNHLLASWRTTESPAELDQRVIASYRGHFNRKRWRLRWLTGSIRIPVPIAAVALLLLCATSFLAARKTTSGSIENPQPVELKIVEVPVHIVQKEIVTRVVYKKTVAQQDKKGPAPISTPPRIDLANFRPVGEIKPIVIPGGNDEK